MGTSHAGTLRSGHRLYKWVLAPDLSYQWPYHFPCLETDSKDR